MIYLPHVDGLRAVAVLGVVLYHAGVLAGQGWAPGGYAGVDVFFVISGFLISSIINNDLSKGSFSLVGFWAKRIRRILPAFLVVAVVTSLLAIFVLIPIERGGFGRSLAASAVFLSNIYFRSASGYFDGAADDQPLLHSWSLSVEEQFYLFWPLFLVFIRSRLTPSLIFGSTCLVFLSSLFFAEYFIGKSPTMVFYYLPSRAWELALGAILAFILPDLSDIPWSRKAQYAVFVAGLSLIAFAFLFFSASKTPFPGVYALIPCIGAGLVICFGGTTFLTSAPLVAIGRRSYSLYLWHWPLLVLFKLYLLRPLTVGEVVFILIVAGVLSELTYRFVERPGRRYFPRERIVSLGREVVVRSDSFVLVYGMIGYGLVFLIGFSFVLLKDSSFLATDKVVRLQRDLDPQVQLYGDCFQRPTAMNLGKFDECKLKVGSSEASATVWVWGDSHARAMFPVISDAVSVSGFSGEIRYAFMSSCSPLIGVKFVSEESPEGPLAKCSIFNDYILEKIIKDDSVHAVVVLGRWTSYLYKNEQNVRKNVSLKVDGVAGGNELVITRSLARLLDIMERKGINLITVPSVPEFSKDAARCIVRALYLGADVERCSEDESSVVGKYRFSKGVVERAFDPLPLMDVMLPVCANGRCSPYVDGDLYYSDSNHLTPLGAARLRDSFKKVMNLSSSVSEGGR